MGFKLEFQEIILSYITTARLAVYWNRKQLEPFEPTRGLRQGDSLSPYLFVLCMEVFSQQIVK